MTRRYRPTIATGRRRTWQMRFVSAYASAHPWEDWAESWAHYLHIVDPLETARQYRKKFLDLVTKQPS